MRILHYALGFPPYRSGGLTKYVIDLAMEQKKAGHFVGVLWPGRMGKGKIRILHKLSKEGLVSYELINPLPVPLLNGINCPEAFMTKEKVDRYVAIFESIKVDVLHIHTLMGLHKEALVAAKKMGIRTIYTTHDYFGLCTKVNMLNCRGEVCIERCNEMCSRCNMSALSLKKIYLMQSLLYRKLKGTAILTLMRREYKKKNIVLEMDKAVNGQIDIINYDSLYEYYNKMFQMIDIFHCNSPISKGVFNSFIQNMKYKVIPITNTGIKSAYKKKEIDKKHIVFGFFGDGVPFKGYWLLLEALDELYLETQNFVLKTFIGQQKDRNYIETAEPFLASSLYSVLDTIDILIVPSIWMETFGMVVPEALSRGVPVIATENVGASCIIPTGAGKVIKPEKEMLINVLRQVVQNPESLLEMNRNLQNFHVKSMSEHMIEINDLYIG